MNSPSVGIWEKRGLKTQAAREGATRSSEGRTMKPRVLRVNICVGRARRERWNIFQYFRGARDNPANGCWLCCRRRAMWPTKTLRLRHQIVFQALHAQPVTFLEDNGANGGLFVLALVFIRGL